MTKSEHIKYWITSSNDDWETSSALFNANRFVHCLFFAHLSLEKICKAIWVKDSEDNFPPKIHNLVKLLKETNQNILESDLIFLEEFNDFQLEGRYPDYLFIVHKKCSKEYTSSLLIKVREIRECLIKKL